MNPRFVDTNIFIEVLARRGEKSDRCLALLESNLPLWTSEMVIAEIEWVLRDFFELPGEIVALHLKRVLSLANLEIPHKKELIEATGIYESNFIDWTDCFNSVLARRAGVKSAYSYDRHFDKLSFVERLEP